MSDRPLRIALFIYSTKPRGSVIHTLELAEALQELGHEVCIYALDKDGSGFHRPLTCAHQSVPAYPAPADIDALIRQRIQEFVDYLGNGPLRSHPYDCYHAQDCISANALAALRQAGEIPHFCRTVHHIEAFNSPYLQACQDRSIREPDLCFCVSDVWQQELKTQYGLDAPKVFNGVNPRKFSPFFDGSEVSLRQQYGLNGYPIYLTVGGIEPRKNSITLLQAFAQVRHYHPQAQLVIAGGATLFDYQTYRDDFFAIAERLKVGPSLVLPGVIPDSDLPALYRCADGFVFPSLKEGWGLVVLEAIASHLPVLTSNQPPFTEFLTPDQALLVDPTSVEAIAKGMRQLVRPTTTATLIRQSQTIAQNYSWTVSAQAHLTHYKSLITPSYA